jgi:uncharacterized membrane protein YgdD (TMEM256/DUF423 family)
MLIVSVLPKTGTFPAEAANSVCWLLLAGILIFSGSLYVLAITGIAHAGRHHAVRRSWRSSRRGCCWRGNW